MKSINLGLRLRERGRERRIGTSWTINFGDSWSFLKGKREKGKKERFFRIQGTLLTGHFISAHF